MKKTIILSFLLIFGFWSMANITSAQEATSTSQEVQAVVVADEITAKDLGIEEPGILPTSPFYFLKNWGRTIRRTITLDPVKKANLELEITNQQAAEINQMEEISPERIDSISGAVENYQSNVERLKTRLDELKETSKNPNVNALLEKLADRSVKHQQLFDVLKKKFEDQDELKNKLESAQERINEAILKIPEKFDNPEAFKKRMKRAIEARPDNLFKEFRGMEMMERIEGKLSQEYRVEFEGVKNELMKKFEDRVNAMPKEAQRTFMLPHVLERMPGDPALRTKILEEMQSRMQLSPAMKEQIELTREQIFEKVIERGEIGEEKAEEQIKRAEKSIEDLGIAIDEPGAQRTPTQIIQIKNLLAQAKKHLNEARLALTAGKYGEAFGHATSADVSARNGLRSAIIPQPIPVPETRLPLLQPSDNTGFVCTQEYRPVCGVNNQTYSNLCRAKVAGVIVSYAGVCKTIETEKATDSTGEFAPTNY